MTCILGKRVEGETGRKRSHPGYLTIGIGRRIGVGGSAKLLVGQSRLEKRAGCRGMDILAEDGKSLPKGEGFEGKNNLDIRLAGHVGDELQIAAQFLFFYNINRCLNTLKSVRIGLCHCNMLNFSAKLAFLLRLNCMIAINLLHLQLKSRKNRYETHYNDQTHVFRGRRQDNFHPI